MKSLEERFWSRVSPEPNSGCWLWIGAVNRHGYGCFSVDNRMRLAHTVAWQLYRGQIDQELELDHLCRTPCCVNPAHLEPVSHTVNVFRGKSPPALNKQKTHCPQGHEYTEENTYVWPRKGYRQCKRCMYSAERMSRRNEHKRKQRAERRVT